MKPNHFYFDENIQIYDTTTNSVVKDIINVLSINTKPDSSGLPFTVDLKWDIVSSYTGLDGYIDNKKVVDQRLPQQFLKQQFRRQTTMNRQVTPIQLINPFQ